MHVSPMILSVLFTNLFSIPKPRTVLIHSRHSINTDLHEWFAQANIYQGMAWRHFVHPGNHHMEQEVLLYGTSLAAHEWQKFLRKQLA